MGEGHGDLIAQRHGFFEVRAGRLGEPGAPAQLGEQCVRLDDEVLFAAGPGGGQRADRCGVALGAARALVVGGDEGGFGVGPVLGGRALAVEQLACARQVSVLERDTGCHAVGLAQVLAGPGGLVLCQRAIGFTARLDRVPPHQRVARGLEGKVCRKPGGHARSQRAAPEGHGVLGVVEQPEAAAKLRQVAENARGGQAVADALAQLERALCEREGLRVVVPQRGEHREIVEREGDGADVAGALAVPENRLEYDPCLLA